jgi:hypothetical protein
MIRRILIIFFCACGVGARAQSGESAELEDLAARIQFDYYARDARALSQDVQALSKLQFEEALGRVWHYYIGYGEWKLADVLSSQDRSAARDAVERCVEETEKAIAAVPKRGGSARPDAMHAELYGIQAACAALPVDRIGLLSGYRAGKAIETAKSLQPANPRVLLIDATLIALKAKTLAEQSAAERLMTAAVTAFEKQLPHSSNVPDWGHAEALARLGALQLERGNKTAARNSVERALVLAGDYVWARELLVKITDNRRN